MNAKHNKKAVGIVAAIAGGAMALGGVYAASLTFTTKQAGQGAAAVATCDAAVTTTNAAPVWNDTTKTYEIASVTVSAIDDDCIGQTVYVTATQDGGAQVSATSNGSETVADGAEDVNPTTVTFAAPVNVNSITGYTVAIVQPAS